MDETRINAAIAELNALVQSLMQRCINLSGDLAVVQKELADLKKSHEPDFDRPN